MTRKGVSPALVGVLLAVVAVGVVAGLLFARGGGSAAGRSELPADAQVMLAVVVPDVRGVATPVVISLYPAFPSMEQTFEF